MTEHLVDLTVALPPGPACGACLAEIRDQLERLDDVAEVRTDPHDGRLTVVVGDDGPDGETVATLVRRAGAQLHCAEHCPAAVHEHPPVDLRAPLPGESTAERRRLHVTGMDCADCAMKIERAVRREPGVEHADINFGAATLDVVWDPRLTSLSEVATVVRRLGYDTLEGRAGAAGEAAASPAGRSFWLHDRRARLALVSGALLVAGFAAAALAPAAAPFLFAGAAVTGGASAGRAAFFALRSRQVDMNVLMSIAVIGAVAIGEWSEAALVAFLFGLGTTLQAATLERTRRAITGLMELAPDEAVLVHEGHEHRVPTGEVAVGQTIVVRPGERVPLDGVVTAGEAAVSQAQVTGESAPVSRRAGDTVFAGSIVEGGSLRLRTTAAADDTTVARIVHMVEEAQAQRAPVQTTVDRFAAKYTPVVVALAAGIALLPPLLGAPFSEWLYRGLALLIVSCPCALVISTPVSILAALGRATRLGALVKGGVSLEQAATVRALAVDKTGTLTRGRPAVTDVVPLAGATRDEVVRTAADVERLSEHPLARAIVTAARDVEHHELPGTGPEGRPDVAGFRAIAGMGVTAEVAGRVCVVGRPGLLGAAGDDPALRAVLAEAESEGATAVVVGADGRALGVIVVSDPLRDEAPEALRRLHGLGIAPVVMLTGDNAAAADAVAARAGVDAVESGLLPADKIAAVRRLRREHGEVAMVGDGVNDAPALAAASLGVAMGAAGTDAALETADIALMGDDLATLPELVALARRTRRIIRQNIVLSIAIKAVFLVLAPLGLTSLWLAVFADMGTSLLVTANGLRLSRG